MALDLEKFIMILNSPNNMKLLFVIIFVFLIVPSSLAQNFEKYDQYDCIVEKIINDCENKNILFTSHNKWEDLGLHYRWQNLEDFAETDEQKRILLKEHLIEREKDILNHLDGQMMSNSYPLIYCHNFSYVFDPYNRNKNFSLEYMNDHFIWQRHTIDCAWIRNKYDVAIDKIEFNGKCPTLIIGDENTLIKDCRDTTFNLSIKEIVFSLGGITLFGISITYLIKFFKKKKKKSKAIKN